LRRYTLEDKVTELTATSSDASSLRAQKAAGEFKPGFFARVALSLSESLAGSVAIGVAGSVKVAVEASRLSPAAVRLGRYCPPRHSTSCGPLF